MMMMKMQNQTRTDQMKMKMPTPAQPTSQPTNQGGRFFQFFRYLIKTENLQFMFFSLVERHWKNNIFSKLSNSDFQIVQTSEKLKNGEKKNTLRGWLAGWVGWAGLGWAGLGWAGLGWAGLGWALVVSGRLVWFGSVLFRRVASRLACLFFGQSQSSLCWSNSKVTSQSKRQERGQESQLKPRAKSRRFLLVLLDQLQDVVADVGRFLDLLV